jgi:hypothetical protein
MAANYAPPTLKAHSSPSTHHAVRTILRVRRFDITSPSARGKSIAHFWRQASHGRRTSRLVRRLRLRSWSGIAAVIMASTAVLLIFSVISTRARPPLTPDSWAYLLLARSFESTPYHLPLVRQYQYLTDAADSFPPVWPLILFLMSRITRLGPWLGILTATVLSAGLLPCIAIMLRPLVRAGGRRIFASVAIWTAILSYGPFLDEILSGRSIPVALIWYVAIGITLTRLRDTGFRTGLVIGGLAGLLWMTRFDSAPVVVILGFGLPLAWQRGRVLPWLAGYGIAVAVMLLPWILYSRSAFGVAFASDNAMVAKSAVFNWVNNWYPSVPPTLRDAPAEWLARVLGNLPNLTALLWRGTVRYAFAPALLAVFAVWTRTQSGNVARFTSRQVGVMLVVVAAFAAQLAGPLTTGFFELRYLTPIFLTVSVWSVALLMTSSVPRFRTMAIVPLLIGAALGWQKSLNAEEVIRQHPGFIDLRGFRGRGQIEGVPIQQLDHCLPRPARVLIASEGVSAYLVGYYVDRVGLELPHNWPQLSQAERSTFLDALRVTHVLGTPADTTLPTIRLRTIPGCAGALMVVQPASRP